MTVKEQTQEHINNVGNYIHRFGIKLLERTWTHDKSKLESPEAETFEIMTDKLKGSTYGTPEYHQMLTDMKPALDHHYSVNSHHPEHFTNGIKGMTLVDIVEMLMDWKAATLRHADGDILKSIELNQKRFAYSDDLKEIFKNTVKEM